MIGAPIRVLVTGAGGFIGQRMIRLAPANWRVTALSRSHFVEGSEATISIDDLPELAPLRFDAVIHLAGNSDHGLAGRAPWADLEATGVVAGRIFPAVSADRLIVLSSAAVYAGMLGEVDPTACTRPAMAYALSKLYVEGLATEYRAKSQFASLTVLRLYNAFGPGERATRLIPRVKAAVRDGLPFPLTGDPESLSDPIHVDEVIRVVTALIRSNAEGIYDLCGGQPTRLFDRIVDVATKLGEKSLRVTTTPDPLQVPIRFFSSPARLTNDLGIEPMQSFSDGLDQYIAEGL